MNALSFTRNPHIPLTIRKKIGKLCGVHAGKSFRIDLFGQNYEGTTGIHMDDKIWLYGMHEPATVRLIRRIMAGQKRAGMTPVYMDIGTNAGMHLIAAADLADKAYGFEPWPAVRQKALHNVALNKLAHVTVFDFGLSDHDATLPFNPPKENNLGVGMFVDDAAEGTINLTVRKGDDVVREHDIQPTMMKMDIEGHEKKALTGLHDTLRRYKPDVIFEYSAGSRLDLGNLDVLRGLFGEEYRFYGIKRSREYPALEPFNPDRKYENVLASTTR
ncbi:MAG: FkbM family methyltransferase [Rhodospirillales bacterium]|nr:FkbM family methyltransferase [Rhodospirillales bacterium]